MKKTLFLLLALLLLLLPGCKHRQPAPTDIQVLRQGSLAPADDDTTPVVYVSVRDQSRHVFGLRAEVERLLRAEKYDITDNPSQAGFIIQASVLEAGITDATAAEAFRALSVNAAMDGDDKGAALYANAAAKFRDATLKSSEITLRERAQTVKEEELKIAQEKLRILQAKEAKAVEAVADAQLTDAERVEKVKSIFGIK